MTSLEDFMAEHIGLREPWVVEEVYSSRGPDGLLEDHIRVGIPMGMRVACPVCGRMCAVHDRPNDRTWRELDTIGRRTYVHARVPRADCPSCGVRQVETPWARPGSHFTLQMESFMVSMVRQMPVSTLARMMHEPAPKVWRVVRTYADRLVERLDLSEVRRVGIDEKCWSGYDGYITVFVDMDTNRIIFVTEGKDGDTVKRFKDFLRAHGGSHHRVTDFGTDFGAAYIAAVRKYFPGAKVTVDRFHLVKLANQALNDTKCGELKLEVNRMKVRYLLARRRDRLSEADLALRERICQDNEVLGIAFRLKESLCLVYEMDDAYMAADHLTDWIRWARLTKLRHFVTLADTVERNIAHILQWFTSRLSNAVLEGTNSLIAEIKRRARGFSDVENLISMCYLVSAQERTDMYGRTM